MIISFYLNFHETEKFQKTRYDYNISSLSDLSDEQIIAFTLIYLYLQDELLEDSGWHSMNYKEINLEELFERIDLTEFFSVSIIDFYQSNIELFRKTNKRKG
jgi:hypothetical protein